MFLARHIDSTCSDCSLSTKDSHCARPYCATITKKEVMVLYGRWMEFRAMSFFVRFRSTRCVGAQKKLNPTTTTTTNCLNDVLSCVHNLKYHHHEPENPPGAWYFGMLGDVYFAQRSSKNRNTRLWGSCGRLVDLLH